MSDRNHRHTRRAGDVPEYEIGLIFANLWAAFGAGAGMLIERDVARKVYEKLIGTVRSEAHALPNRRALECCRKAGQLAAAKAGLDERDFIEFHDFEEAYSRVEAVEAERRGRLEPVRGAMQGNLCDGEGDG